MPGNETAQPPADTEQTPEDAFALVGNEIRAEIIRVLGVEDELSFSELRSRLNTDINPSQLHYHLQQLVGHFVTETDDGYQLGPVGSRLCRTLRAGTFDRRKEHLTVAADFDCYYCQAPVKAIFDNGHARIECPDCEQLYLHDFYNFSPEAFEDEAAAFSHFSIYIAIKSLFLARGVCPSCANPLNPEFHSREENPPDNKANVQCLCRRGTKGVTCPHCDSTDTAKKGPMGKDAQRYRCHTCDKTFNDGPYKVRISQSCDLCGGRWWLSVGMALLADPILISFCYDHGVDVRSIPSWELEFAKTDNNVTIHSADPWEVALQVTYDSDTLELIVDGNLNVLKRNRLDTSEDMRSSLPSNKPSNSRPRGSKKQGDEMSLPDTTDCLRFLRRHRWPAGVRCPHCNSADTIKKGTTSKGAQRYRCHTCDSSFNDLTGTIFAKRGLSLPEMFYIIREMNVTKTVHIARQLDRSYQAVLNFVHETRDAAGGNSDIDLSSIRNGAKSPVSSGENRTEHVD